MSHLWVIVGVGLVSAGAPGQAVVDRPTGEPLLRAADERATVEAWAELPEQPMDLLGRFEAVVEVRADAGVRIDNWSIDDAFGDSFLVTVAEAHPLENRAELEGWFGRYAVVVEPLLDGDLRFGPLALTYLVDPDDEADPAQLQAVRTRIESSALDITVRGPAGELPGEAAPAKGAVTPEEPFDWRALLIAGATVGVLGPVLAALVLAARSTRQRVRSQAPEKCLEELNALRRALAPAETRETGLGVNGAAVASEAMGSVRRMLDETYRLRTAAMSGPEMLESAAVRAALSAEALEHLRRLVEASEGVRFAGVVVGADEAKAIIGSARALADAIRAQRGAIS